MALTQNFVSWRNACATLDFLQSSPEECISGVPSERKAALGEQFEAVLRRAHAARLIEARRRAADIGAEVERKRSETWGALLGKRGGAQRDGGGDEEGESRQKRKFEFSFNLS